MSQNLAVVHDGPVPFASEATKNLGVCLGYLNHLDEVEEVIYREIPDAEDEALVGIYEGAKRAETFGWRVRAACCFEAMKRRFRLKGGRGNVDMNEEGARAYAEAVGKEFGCGVDRVYEDTRLYRTFLAPDVPKPVREARTTLLEKTYYLEAERSEDPHFVIVEMAKEKQRNHFFNSGRARSFVAKLDTEVIETDVVLPPEMQQKIYEDRAEWIAAKIEIVATWAGDAPTPELKARARRWLSELRWEKTRSPEKENRRVLSAIRLNLRNVPDIADQAGISERETRTILARLLAADLVQCRVKGGETEVSRGSRQEYWALKGETLGSDVELFPERKPYYECDVDE